MAGLPWIELHRDLPDHPKSILLGVKLRDERAWTYMVQLWLWCAAHAPFGRFDGPASSVVIERAAGWRGEPGALLAAAVECGFIDDEGGTMVIHGWDERAAAHLAKAEKDRERQRRWREQAKANFSVTNASVTRDKRVTNGGVRGESRGNKDSNKDIDTKTEEPPLSATADREQLVLTPVDSTQPSPAQQVFAHWCAVMKKRGTAVFDAKRRRAVEARLKDGYSVADLCRAIDGCALTPHNMGKNDNGQRYDDLELICRDAAHVDRFVANARQPPAPNQPEPKRHPEIWRKLRPGEDIYADPYGEDA